METLCDIVVPVWDQPKRTRRCLESVAACTPPQARLILVDNGSRPPARALLEEFARQGTLPAKLIRNERNLGFIRAANQGIRAATSAWVCLLNNDTVVTGGWLEEMLRVAQADPRIGLVNPTSNSLGFHAGSTPLEQYARGLKAQAGKWTELSVALGFCLLARRDLFDRIGLLDESFGMGNFDDDDLSRRVRGAGLLCARACAAYVYHEEKVSFRQLPGWQKEFDRNRRRFEEKWGRRLRLLWVTPGAPFTWPATLGPAALQLAKQGHWVCFACHPGEMPTDLASHAQVSTLPLSRIVWRPKVLWRLLTKRKKPFTLVVTHDPACASQLRRLRWIHRAEVLLNPTPEQVVEQCRTQSRSRSWSTPEEARPLPAATPLPLSVVIITKNEASRLGDCLESVRWAGEIVVVDDESTDQTVEITRRYTDRVIVRKMEIEGRHRNFAYDQARHDWVLSLDADERVTPELKEEIIRLLRGNPEFKGYTMPRRNYLGSVWVRNGGWYPSPQLRLFRKDSFRYEEVEVHPRAFMNAPSGELKHDLIHYSYRDLADFLAKLNRQTTLEAQKWVKDGRRMPLRRGLWRTVDRSFRTWWIRKGYRDGLLGFIVAAYAGLYQFLSYAKYWHLKNKEPVPFPGVPEPVPFPGGTGSANEPVPPGNGTVGTVGRTISAVILTKNAAATLPACLESIRWVGQIVVVDGGSTDGTLRLAQEAGATVVTDLRTDDFGGLRNAGTDHATGDWVLQLDADEVVTPEFRAALEELLAQPPAHAAYKFRRQNIFLGRRMRFGGWDHDSLHLFRRGLARYEGRVHERLLVQGSVGRLRAGVVHSPFRSLEEFIDRQNRYTTLEARQLHEANPHPSEKELRYQIRVKSAKLFWKLYVRKQGFREGTVGLIFCVLYAFVHLIKWAKYWEMACAS